MSRISTFTMVLLLSLLCLCPLNNVAKSAQREAANVTHGDDLQRQFELALHYLREGDVRNLPKARQLFALAGRGGHGQASYYAAVMFDQGIGGYKDKARALRLYQDAANAGDLITNEPQPT
jgi:TPR repeat protein